MGKYEYIYLVMYIIFFSVGPLTTPGEPEVVSAPPPGRRLIIPLNICVLQGLSFVNARLLSMEIPARIGEACAKLAQLESGRAEQVSSSERQADRFMKIDPYRGSWGLRLLELELYNPTDVVFETSVSVDMENSSNNESLSHHISTEFGEPKTRIDRDYTARVLIPLEHFKLPVLDGSFLGNSSQVNGNSGRRNSSFSEKNIKAELNASIKNLKSKIKVKWQSGRNSSGELDIKDAIQAALQASVMDVLLPDPLTFGFRLSKSSLDSSADLNSPGKADGEGSSEVNLCISGDSVIAHEMTAMEVLVRNNTKESIGINLSITCKDVAGENCIEGDKATVLWEGASISKLFFP